MRSTRILTAAALTASGLVLSAGAAAAQTADTPNPDIKSYPSGPSCAADKLTGSVRVGVVASTLPKGSIPKAVVQLRWNAGGTAFTDTSVLATQTFNLTAGASDYAYSLDMKALPASAKNVIAYTLVYPNGTASSSDTLSSRVLATSFCGASAPAAPATTKITSVDLTCSGDVLSGRANLVDPPTSGTVPGSVAVQLRATGATTWTTAAPAKTFTVGAGTTSMPYEVSIAGKHGAEYRTRATVNNGAAVFSPIVADTTCAPAEVVPEAPAAALIPLTLAATAGAVVVVRRRRSTALADASA